MNTTNRQQIFLDTETTGLNKLGVPYKGHRIIEIGAVEMINRHLTGNNFHVYLKPDRQVDPEAYAIHGISNDFLVDKPTFANTAKEFLNFIRGANLVIHNATFDISFIDYEFSMLNESIPKVETFCTITDSLVMARRLFPGKRNNLDALCDRYHINNTKRKLHGALLDAEILADVYLAMTSGQTSISFLLESNQQLQSQDVIEENIKPVIHPTSSLKIIHANTNELAEHKIQLDIIAKKGKCLWHNLSFGKDVIK
ncbi:DNA polymerase III subunit epsilon [Candidatus Fukatsuia anoeciicola]|uniref:DNA polymerase III subunit epsilon n=1 Tax=Candidatus Fukatsuia anoeciicola TaxID=2994492 RepID=UPI00346389EC